jgi:hypothetical protein
MSAFPRIVAVDVVSSAELRVDATIESCVTSGFSLAG